MRRADIGHRDAVFELLGDGPAEPVTVRGRRIELTSGEPVEVALGG